MTSNNRENHKLNVDWQAGLSSLAIILAFGSMALVSCLQTEIPLATPSVTLVSTSTTTPTETVVWFPPTVTATPFSTPIITPTEVLKPEFGNIIFSDDFSNGNLWSLNTSEAGSVALGINELTIAISNPDTYIFTIRDEPLLGDFYAEITASPTLCRTLDEYGILFRWGSMSDFYRYSLSCDGQVRLDRLTGGTAASPKPWTSTGIVPSGAPKSNRMAVWVNDKEMRFYIDEILQFSLSDPMLSSGLIGLFARSADNNALTVNFSDLIVSEVR